MIPKMTIDNKDIVSFSGNTYPNVIATEKYPIKLWLNDIENGAVEQIKNVANLPFIFKHVAIMPDCHQGYGMPIGGVAACKDTISPNMVGVDIGCGMCAIKTSAVHLDSFLIKKIMGKIREIIPVGFDHHKEEQDEKYMPMVDCEFDSITHPIVAQQYHAALRQVGTLGGGNHFIEIQKGNDGFIWLMVHSGSRNIGYKVANHYVKEAKEVNEKYFSSVLSEWDLSFFPFHSVEGQRYKREMNYCVDFAFASRKLMMERIKEIVTDVIGNVTFDDMINIAHNYAAMENHYGRNVVVHRKGATRAREGEIGIIPGSQGTHSYIVSGLGNRQSFMSCSHGAGRVMGRKQAKRELFLEDEIKRLDEAGIIHSIRTVQDLDEAPSAYKNIGVVMKNQEDLVEVLVELTPLAVIKG